MKSFLWLLFISSLLLTSCKQEVETPNNSTPTNIVPFTEVGKQAQNQQALTATQAQQNPNITNQNTAATTAGTATTGMNPAHGQSGHRCDIPVGAPLNSPATAASPTPATPQQNPAVPAATVTTTTTPTVTTTAPTVPTAEGMNPPHGQENHRCDIAVGAPLPK